MALRSGAQKRIAWPPAWGAMASSPESSGYPQTRDSPPRTVAGSGLSVENPLVQHTAYTGTPALLHTREWTPRPPGSWELAPRAHLLPCSGFNPGFGDVTRVVLCTPAPGPQGLLAGFFPLSRPSSLGLSPLLPSHTCPSVAPPVSPRAPSPPPPDLLRSLSPQANVCYFICLERAYLFSDVWPPGRLL